MGAGTHGYTIACCEMHSTDTLTAPAKHTGVHRPKDTVRSTRHEHAVMLSDLQKHTQERRSTLTTIRHTGAHARMHTVTHSETHTCGSVWKHFWLSHLEGGLPTGT